MAFTISDLATELGIDPATLTSKPEVTAKWNGYLSEADNKYRQATEAVEQAKRDQQAIDDEIKKFGITEARTAELEASNAALTAALAKAKESGLNIDLSGIPTPAARVATDPNKEFEAQMKNGFAQMGAALKIQARYQSVFGKPFGDDPVKLIDEAIAARLPVEAYAEQKYKFADEEKRISAETIQRDKDTYAAQKVREYQEANPVTKGNPSLAAGLASKYPKVMAPRTPQESKEFRSMPIKDRIASSVSRAREAIAATAAD